jgi:hypothetical protein
MISAFVKSLWGSGCGLGYLSKVVQVFGLSLCVIQSVCVSRGQFQVGCGVSRPDITYHSLFASLYQLINVSYV